MKLRYFLTAIIAIAMLCSCSSAGKYDKLQQSLTEFVKDKDANIGIAVIIDGRDTISVNGDKEFPMLSVYKFPITLAFAEHCRNRDLPFDYPVSVFPEDLHPDTYSPMTEKILASSRLTTDTLKMPAIQLTAYMLQQSDNNASDIVLRETGGAESVDSYLRALGISQVNVRNSEADMHTDQKLCYDNTATPIAMASLVDKFDREFKDSISLEIKRLMETCSTGIGRLAQPLSGSNALIGHKTGTGFILPDGRIMAVNDVGYVHMPDNGCRYSIAVFFENSGYDMTDTESIIAEISRIVFSYLSKR